MSSTLIAPVAEELDDIFQDTEVPESPVMTFVIAAEDVPADDESDNS
nr:hypothetical protein OH820_09675 [Streptomyces sp. NBC_00857]